MSSVTILCNTFCGDVVRHPKGNILLSLGKIFIVMIWSHKSAKKIGK